MHKLLKSGEPYSYDVSQLLLYIGLQKNFGKPVEWALVKDHAWSTPQLRKLDQPVRITNPFKLCKHSLWVCSAHKSAQVYCS